MTDRDPVLRSFQSDGLPDDDPRVFDTLTCVDCGKVVHSIPNECMATWLDTAIGPVCWECANLRHDTDRWDEL